MSLADSAVLLVGHGSTKGPAAIANLRRHAARLARVGAVGEVHVATLHGPGPRPAEVIRTIRHREVFVVPVTMCDGQTLREVPRLGPVNEIRLRFCPPVGAHPSLAELIARRATTAAHRMGFRADETALLLVAHGSLRNPASERAARRQAALLQTRGFANVAVAFLDQDPRPADALTRLPGPAVVIGLFAGGGRHATDDMDRVFVATGRTDIAHLGAIGMDAAIASVIVTILRGIHESLAREVGGGE